MSSRQRLKPLDFNSISFENMNVTHLFRHNELAKDRACLMDLRCLCGKTDFLPGTAFVRGEMQTTFKELCEKKAGKKHILIGSPGVGKSVVFFLSALSLSAVKRKQVIYATWDKKKPTVFLMKPGQSEGFCQLGSISFYKVQYSLEDVARAALDYGYESDKEDCRFFLDGPKEAEVKELTDLDYFLCTSGGYSTPSDSERMTVVIDIMPGWMENDLVAALIQVKKISPNQARRVYGACGGRMRLALDYMEDEQTTISWADSIVADQSADTCTLAMTETESRTSVESKDRLRTMFRGSTGRPVQLVDSQYLLGRLRDKLTIDNLRQAYRVAVALDSRTMMGVLFEEIMHKWVERVKPNPVSNFVRSPKGRTMRDGVADLSTSLLYWVPSTSNFANIDAAFVDASAVLHCIQYTIKASHDFDKTTFDNAFIRELKTTFPAGFSKVVVYFAVPVGVDFDIQAHEEFECDYDTTTCEFKVIHLNVNTDDEIKASAALFPFLL